MKKILITGGAGFIGSNLTNKLAHYNDVTIIDNFSSGKIENLTEVLHLIKIIDEDICNINICNIGDFDEIYHLACQASPPKYQENSIHTLDTCYIGTKNILQIALRNNSRMLFTSTSEIYGNPQTSPQPESYNGNVSTTTTRACYDEGKRVAETLCYEYYKLGVDIRIARLFNTYGPKMDEYDGRVVSNFITELLSKKELTIYGDGNQTRSFCYISDTLEALLKFMCYSQNELTILNIGNNNEIKISKLAKIVALILKKNYKTRYLPLPEADPTNRNPDISKAKNILNWKAYTSLENGLQKTIAYFNSNLNLEKKITNKT